MKSLLALFCSATLLLGTSNATQFQNFYDFYRTTLTTERPDCHAYYDASTKAQNTSNPNTCKHMAECLLAGAGEINKADWSSATVLLGLTPSILGLAAPTIEERLQLLRERPILGLLSIIAAPSLTFSRPWIKPDNPDKERTSWIRLFAFGRDPKVYWIVVQYVSVALATANVIENTIRLGNQTIISWKCNMTYLELAWALLAPVPILVALIRYLGPGSRKTKPVEATGTTEVFKTTDESTTEETPIVDLWEGLLNSVANICGLVHVVFGTIVLSSVQFIGTLDALGVVGRFTASALIIQFITMTQLYGKPDVLPTPKGVKRLEEERDLETQAPTKEPKTKVKEKVYGIVKRLDRTSFRERVYGMDGNGPKKRA